MEERPLDLEARLRASDAILQAVSFAAQAFLQSPWKDRVEEVIGRLGEAAGVSRAYVFETHRGRDGSLRHSQRFEWVSQGVVPLIDHPVLQDFSLQEQGTGRWEEVLGRGEAVYGNTSRMPEAERPILKLQGIRSVAVVPVFAGEEWWGFIGFDECTSEREWTPAEIEALKVAAGTLGTAIRRERAENAVAGLNVELERRVAERTAELELANRNLRRAKDEAERGNRAKSEFLSRMSHELRTPLNAILGFGQLMQMDGPGGEHADGVEQILKAGRHLLDLINEVLDVARIESGRMWLTPEQVRVTDAIGEAVSLAGPLAAERNIEIVFREEGSPEAWVLAQRQRLKQVILNLLSNAVKYNHDGGSVTISGAKASATRFRIHVADTGHGLHREEVDRLFTPFERLRAGETGVEGTGLGLALSKGLIEAMGGTISVESAVGVGTTFTVELPLVARTAGRPEHVIHRDRLRPDTRTAILLHIEDNPSNLRLVERVLEGLPRLKLIPAMRGRTGVELARRNRPDLVLLDLNLPDIPGQEVLALLREDARTRGIPVIVISADATPGRVRELLSAGAVAYLAKPIDLERLLEVVSQALGGAVDSGADRPTGVTNITGA